MITFNPGPSKVYPQIKEYLNDAFDEGILSIPHRSEKFSEIYLSIIDSLREKLNVPIDYSVYFFSSATECWSVISEGAVEDSTVHAFNGTFGKRWYNFSYKINQRVARIELDPDESWELIKEEPGLNTFEMLCVSQNETANGTQFRPSFLRELRKLLPECLFTIDATSSLGGIDLPIQDADIWFASVQKCFGLPAGLAIMVCSPRTVELFYKHNYNDQFNSLINTHQNYLKLQTTHTPNVLNIYLLHRVLKEIEPIQKITEKILARSARLYDFFDSHPFLVPYVRNKVNRSDTVVTVTAMPGVIKKVREEAEKQGIFIGAGFDFLKEKTLRIANFPAIDDTEFEMLLQFLSEVRR